MLTSFLGEIIGAEGLVLLFTGGGTSAILACRTITGISNTLVAAEDGKEMNRNSATLSFVEYLLFLVQCQRQFI